MKKKQNIYFLYLECYNKGKKWLYFDGFHLKLEEEKEKEGLTIWKDTNILCIVIQIFFYRQVIKLGFY